MLLGQAQIMHFVAGCLGADDFSRVLLFLWGPARKLGISASTRDQFSKDCRSAEFQRDGSTFEARGDVGDGRVPHDFAVSAEISGHTPVDPQAEIARGESVPCPDVSSAAEAVSLRASSRGASKLGPSRSFWLRNRTAYSRAPADRPPDHSPLRVRSHRTCALRRDASGSVLVCGIAGSLRFSSLPFAGELFQISAARAESELPVKPEGAGVDAPHRCLSDLVGIDGDRRRARKGAAGSAAPAHRSTRFRPGGRCRNVLKPTSIHSQRPTASM